jgi:hypothetical protein
MTITHNMLNREGNFYNRLDRNQAYKDAEWLKGTVEHSKIDKVRHALHDTEWPVEYISIITNCSVNSIEELNRKEKIRP